MREPGPPMLPLVLEGIGFSAGGRDILSGIDLVLEAGPRTVILGPNGAGKSVLMRICHGLLAPTSGRVLWSHRERPGEPRRQAMVFQRPVLLRRSVLGNLTFALAVVGVPHYEREARAVAALGRVGLAAHARRPARVLSGGEQQRLALARAWMLEPEVLFLDEPTANLDPGAVREIEAIVQSIHASGTKVVMVTHNLGQARRLGDEVVFLDRGRIVERSAIDRFFRTPATAQADAFLKGELPWH
ncbi:MAG: ATP-binding cassette domain-containing protein [Betaproteobacteria bacterium]|jgi:tungstate transport system ATP-binding protein|nr:ATP-binding cassette domain-containing protein [Betaproteobacteria bacterium]